MVTTTNPSFEKVVEANLILQSKIHKTPVLTNTQLNKQSGFELYFKCENFQKIGAFKIRGATFALQQLVQKHGLSKVQDCGVCTHSSGNHAQALALAAQELKIPTIIVMPKGCPKVKKEAVKGYGATIIECENSAEARVEGVNKILKEKNYFLIPPFDHPDIIAGQGTAALELLEQVKELNVELDLVIAPVGGGGLMSGTCIAVKGSQSTIKVIAGEPEGANDCYLSKYHGKHILNEKVNTIADGLRTSLGQYTYPIIKELLDDVFTVNDEKILLAMKLVWERMKIVIEPSAAVPLAVVLFNEEFKLKYGHLKKIGIIFSGGNIDLDPFFNILK